MKQVLTLFLILSGLAINLVAQTNYKFISYQSTQGLSDNVIYSILQDKEGFLWVGSSNGLNRFDGYSFKQFLHHEDDTTSISGNHISEMYEDKNGSLWIATRNNGLNLYVPKTHSFIRYQHHPNKPNSLSSNSIKCITGDGNGNLWIGTSDKGLNFLDTKNNTIKKYRATENGLTSDKISSLCLDAKGNLWIGTYDVGMICLNKETQKFSYYTHNGENDNSLSSNRINCIFESSDSSIWVGTYTKGLNRYNVGDKSFTRYHTPTDKKGYFSNSVKSIYEDSKGRLWIGSWGNGLFYFDKEKNEFRNYQNEQNNPYGLSDNRVYSVFEDKTQQLWIGTEVGLTKTDLNQADFNQNNYGKDNIPNFSGHKVYGVLEDSSKNIWISSYVEGLYRYNYATESMRNYKGNPSNPNALIKSSIWCGLEDKKGRLWFGNSGGLLLYNPEEDNFKRFLNDSETLKEQTILCLTEDHKGKLWMGTWQLGLTCFDPEKNTHKTYLHNPDDSLSISSNTIRTLYFDSQKRLWIGGFNSLDLFDDNNAFIRYKIASSEGQISAIFEDSDKQIWIGAGKGLYLFDQIKKTFKHIQVKEKNEVVSILGIIEDKHKNLWISTHSGICKYNRQDKTSIWYDNMDGLQDNSFTTGAVEKGSDTRFYFGGTNGFNTFNPDNIKPNTLVPQVVITNFLLFRETVKIGKDSPLKSDLNHTGEIILNYDQNVFSFEFSALNFRQSEKNQYAYILEGYDKNWVKTDYQFRRAGYTKVPPGTYFFRVKASNDDGYWNETGVSIKIIITPPWWGTWWAISLWVLVSFGSLLFIYILRVSTLKKHKRKLEQTVKERTAQIVKQKEEIQTQAEELRTSNEKLVELDEFKQGMTGMIVHDLKNPLNGIINTSEDDPIKSLLRTKQSGKQMLNMVMNILDVNKYQDNQMIVNKSSYLLGELAQNAIEEIRFLAERKNISITNKIQLGVSIKGDQEVIERIFTNILTNAIKYSPNNRMVHLHISQDIEDFIRIEIADNGQGISQNQLHKVFEKFGQIQAKKSGQVRSTGLGLTFCKLAVEAHGGKIGLESELGQGTTFWFTLPKGKLQVPHKESTPEGELQTFKVVESLSAELALDEDSKTILKPFHAELSKLEVYLESEVQDILEQVKPVDNSSLQKWKEGMRNALDSMNEEKYAELVGKIV
jgi:ligand-binding sensor domain-containing protein/signal transduction histidine kinase